VKAEIMRDHEMHAEWLQVRIEIIEELIECKSPVTAVGTTSLRTLESLYWLGVKVRTDPDIETLQISQWEVYKDSMMKVSKNESLSSLLAWMKKKQLENVIAHTKLLIVPGYKFRIADVLVTNFHQPQSTLLLLIAAVTGKNWKDLYNYAIDNDFRFLSYGDGSVLYIDESFKAE
jgi:S-adenosylmethionine:tRNA ribosyltransferase-isomerase